MRNKRVEFLANGKSPLISREEAAAIKAHGSDALDPKLRKNDGYTRTYPQTIPPDQRAIWPIQSSLTEGGMALSDKLCRILIKGDMQFKEKNFCE